MTIQNPCGEKLERYYMNSCSDHILMRLLRLTALAFLSLLLCVGALAAWAALPIRSQGNPVEFTVPPGAQIAQIAQLIADTGAPLPPILFDMLARVERRAGRLKAGTYAL